MKFTAILLMLSLFSFGAIAGTDCQESLPSAIDELSSTAAQVTSFEGKYKKYIGISSRPTQTQGVSCGINGEYYNPKTNTCDSKVYDVLRVGKSGDEGTYSVTLFINNPEKPGSGCMFRGMANLVDGNKLVGIKKNFTNDTECTITMEFNDKGATTSSNDCSKVCQWGGYASDDLVKEN